MYHNLGLKTDGSIVAWGRNSEGQTNLPEPNADFVAIAGGGLHSLGLKADGSIVAWGENSAGQLNVPLPNTDFIAIAASGLGLNSLGLKADGSIVAWGRNQEGETEVPSPNAGFIAFDGGYTHILGARGTGVCCDHDPFGACTDGVTQAACDCPTCEWLKLGSCSELDCPHTAIPTVSEWGLVVLALLLSIGAKLAFRRCEVRFLSRS